MNKNKYRETQKKYDNEHFKSYTVSLSKQTYDKMEKCIEKLDTNRNRFTNQAIEEKIEREN